MKEMTIKMLGKQDQREAASEHDIAGWYADLIDSHVKQLCIQEIILDLAEPHDEEFVKIFLLKVCKPRSILLTLKSMGKLKQKEIRVFPI